MYIIAGIYFIYLNFLIILSKKYSNKIVSSLYIIFFIILNFYLSSYISDYSRDFSNYSDWFDQIYYSGFWENITGKDPGFKTLVSFIQLFLGNNYAYIYFIYMMLIFFFKYKFSREVFSGISLLIFFWIVFCSTFVLYEITQIRVGLAIAFASYIIIISIYNKPSFWTWSLLLLSYFFHQSISILLICYLVLIIFNKQLINRFFIIGMLLLGLFVNVFFQDKLSDFIGFYLMSNERAENYLNGVENLSKISLFSFFFLSKIIIIAFLLFYWEFLSKAKRAIVFLSALGCFFYMVFMFNGVFAVRVSELFILFSLACFVFPLELKVINKDLKYLWLFILFILGGVFLYSSSKILLDYAI